MDSWNDGWEKHEAKPKRLRKNEVSLTKANIVFSKELGKEFQAKRVSLEFRQNPRTIKIRPSADGEAGYVVIYRSISSHSFYKHFNITERGRFAASIQQGAIVIPLSDQSTCD